MSSCLYYQRTLVRRRNVQQQYLPQFVEVQQQQKQQQHISYVAATNCNHNSSSSLCSNNSNKAHFLVTGYGYCTRHSKNWNRTNRGMQLWNRNNINNYILDNNNNNYSNQPQSIINRVINNSLLNNRISSYSTKSLLGPINTNPNNDNNNSRKVLSIQQSWKNVIQRLLTTIPIGSYQPIHYNQIEQSIDQLEINHTINNNIQIVELLFQLLDRIWKESIFHKEQQQQLPNNDNENFQFKFCLRPELVTKILYCWKNTIQYNKAAVDIALQSDPSLNSSYIPDSPIEVWDHIKKYSIDGILQCNGITYSIILHSYGIYSDPIKAPELAEQLLFQDIIPTYQQYFSNTNNNYESHPNTATINAVLQLWNQSGHPQSYQRVDKLYQLLKDWDNTIVKNDDAMMKPTSYTIATIISTWTKSVGLQSIPSLAAANRAKELINDYTTYQSSISSSKLGQKDPVLYSTVCCALAKAGDIDGAQEYLNIVLRLLYPDDNPNNDNTDNDNDDNEIQLVENETEGNILSYTVSTVLQALGKANQLTKMEQLIHQIAVLSQQQHPKQQLTADGKKHNNVGLDQVCYRTLIHAYAYRGLPKKAEDAVQHMIHYMNIQPDIGTWNAVLHAYAKRSDSGGTNADSSITKIQSILTKLYDSHDATIQPNIESYNILLRCMTNISSNTNDPIATVQRAERYLLETMEHQQPEEQQSGSSTNSIARTIPKPDSISYATILRAWCKINQPDRAEQLLNQIHINYQAGRSTVSPTSYHYGTVMTGWSTQLRRQHKQQRTKTTTKNTTKKDNVSQNNSIARMEQLLDTMIFLQKTHNYDCKPTTVIYNILLDGLSNSKRPGTVDQARSIFQNMIQLYIDNEDYTVKPDTVTLNTVLSVLLRSNDESTTNVVTITNDIWDMAKKINIPLDAIVYTTKMAIFAKYGQIQYVQDTFDEMVKIYNNNPADKTMRPVFYSYITLLQTKAKIGDIQGTASVLSDIIKQYENGNINFQPTTQTFNAVLEACLRSKNVDSGDKAYQGLHVMNQLTTEKRLIVPPDLRSYTTVLGCYEYTTNPITAADRALVVYNELQSKKDIVPDLRLYIKLISILSKAIVVIDDSDNSTVITMKLKDIITNEIPKIPKKIWQEQGYFSITRIQKILQQSQISEVNQLVDDIVQLGNHNGVVIVNNKNKKESITTSDKLITPPLD